MKLPFQKKPAPQVPSAPAMPPEVQQYYQAERRERTGVAWLLAIGTLLITLAIILGLFFGGRWLYRKVAHRNTSTTTSQTDSGSSTLPGSTNNKNQGSNGNSGQTSGGATSGNTSSGTPKNTSAPNTGTGQPSTGSKGGSTSGGVVPPTAARTNIPNTGPGDTIGIFFAVSVAGYLLHRLVLAKKQ